MPSDFEMVWTDIGRTLNRGDIVRNWSAGRAYTGGSFKIDDLDRTSITVSGGKMKTPRRISRGDFLKLYAIWDAYASGNYPRSKTCAISQNSTYVLSILHLISGGDGIAS